jgi:hypothetical protein
MRRGFKIASLFVLVGLSLAATVVSSAAWFYESADVSNAKINGSSEGAYFAYGDGSAEHPFGINHPRHMYNLSWLNMRGYFDGKTVYFELDPKLSGKVLDCEGYVIPPIGTVEHPFMGNFDGNGCKITNLTVSNNEGDIKAFGKYPYNAFANVGEGESLVTKFWPNDGPQIVGLFGVVGPTNYSEGAAVSSTNEIVDLGIENVTIRTTTAKTLAGIAAGYLNGNLDNVAVNNCILDIDSNSRKLDSYTNVSDYSLVGYATPTYQLKLSKNQFIFDVPDITHAAGGSGGSDWNASIDMENMYNNILPFLNASTNEHYKNYEHRIVNSDGETTVVESDSQYTDFDTFRDENNATYRYKKAESVVDGKKIASFSFAARTNSSRFLYLYGDSNTDKLVANGLNVRTDYDFNAITDGDGNFMISSSNIAVSNSTSFTSASAIDNGTWTIDSSGHIKNKGRNVYLYAYSNTEVRTAATAGNGTEYVWTYDSTNNRLSVVRGGTTLYLVYQNGWKLVTATDTYQKTEDYYYIRTSTTTPYYLNVTWNGTTPTLRASTTTNNTQWYKDGNYYYVLRSGSTNKYYLAYNSNTVTVANTTSNRFQLNYNNRLYYSKSSGWSTTTYYIYVNNGAISRAQNNYSNFAINFATSNVVTYLDKPVYRNGSASFNSTEDSHYNTNPTYFPLSYADDGTVSDENTGYVISGNSNYKGDIRVSQYYTNNLYASLNLDAPGDYWTESNYSNYTDAIDSRMQVVSASAKTNGQYYLISDSHNTNASGTPANPSSTFASRAQNAGVNATFKSVKDFGFKKYNSARNGLKTMFDGGKKIYGLHFMDALISEDNLVKVPYAKVNDKEKSKLAQGEDPFSIYDNVDYEMPRDSIDFHLASKGTINFFAGTYFGGNDTFFSLHSIERYAAETTDSNGTIHGANSIKSIKEISKIYQNFYTGSDIADEDERNACPYTMKNAPYIYQYSDSSYSDPNASTHMTYGKNSQTLVFDMSWVTNPAMIENAVYYFEIPVNKGEFALGSVSTDSVGAYLMYLDIGAASVDTDTTQINEKVTKEKNDYVVPSGIDFAETTTVSGDINGGSTMTITIPNLTTGSFLFSYDGDSKTLSCDKPSGTKLPNGPNNLTIPVHSIVNGSSVKSTFINDDISLSTTLFGTNGTISVTSVNSKTEISFKRTIYTYVGDTATLYKYVYYNDTYEEDEEGWEEALDERIIETDLFNYEALDEDEIIYSGTDPFGSFRYLVFTSSSDPFPRTENFNFQDITFDYDYNNHTYTITNYSSSEVTIYIISTLTDGEDVYKFVIGDEEYTYTDSIIAVTVPPTTRPTNSNNGGGN